MIGFALRVLLLALSFGIGTWVLGWWSVPLFAAAAGVLARNVARQAAAAAVAGAVAWAALLAWSATSGSVWSFSRIAGGAMGISGWLLIVMTLVFPAVLAWISASLAQLIARGKTGTN